ncbi:hypothetical protein CC78DRAFT_547662 [Lojkania enalia]|uniref:Uncharacterized protein n=1 Tax=Lojkania enalia TaxID=147567 RepID=A0A9P4K3M9_9PLEO|nr:hypothetical protein CC78DRAFT_547662 [Didymosphaeria enalia]
MRGRSLPSPSPQSHSPQSRSPRAEPLGFGHEEDNEFGRVVFTTRSFGFSVWISHLLYNTRLDNDAIVLHTILNYSMRIEPSNSKLLPNVAHVAHRESLGKLSPRKSAIILAAINPLTKARSSSAFRILTVEVLKGSQKAQKEERANVT